jgi:hypothetical protein
MAENERRSTPIPIREILMPDVNGRFTWLGTNAVEGPKRKTTTEVDVEMLRSDRVDVIAQIDETDRQGEVFQYLREELHTVTSQLLSAEADLYEQQRSQQENRPPQ